MTVRYDPTAIKAAANAPNVVAKKYAIYTSGVASWPYLDINGVWQMTTDSAHPDKCLLMIGVFNLLKICTILPNFVIVSSTGVTFRVEPVPDAVTGVLWCRALEDGNADATAPTETL